MPFYERQPYVQALHQILREVIEGDILVPRFQRKGTEFTWTPEQRQNLLDSIYRGFPIGTILLWTSPLRINHNERVGGMLVQPGRETNISRYLLDGHQRLSTLIMILGAGLFDQDADPSPPSYEIREYWFFNVADDASGDGKNRFIWQTEAATDEAKWVPLNIILNLSHFNNWIRDRTLTKSETRQFEGLRDKMREYLIPVAVLQADTLEEATESFQRINSSGTRMDSFNMLAALAYQNDFDLQALFSEARDEFLAPLGWERISDTDMARIMLGILGRDPIRAEPDIWAKQLRDNQEVVIRGFHAAVGAIGHLIRLGIYGPAVLPYSWQLIILAIALHQQRVAGIVIDETALEKWLWQTTYGEVFGRGTRAVPVALSELRKALAGQPWSLPLRFINQRVEVAPHINYHTARGKACLLAMAELQDRGAGGSAHRALVNGESAVKAFLKQGKGLTWENLCIVTDWDAYLAFHQKLHRYPEPGQYRITDQDSALLARLGFDQAAGETMVDAMKQRKDAVLAIEKSRVQQCGLFWRD